MVEIDHRKSHQFPAVTKEPRRPHDNHNPRVTLTLGLGLKSQLVISRLHFLRQSSLLEWELGHVEKTSIAGTLLGLGANERCHFEGNWIRRTFCDLLLQEFQAVQAENGFRFFQRVAAILPPNHLTFSFQVIVNGRNRPSKVTSVSSGHKGATETSR